MFTQAARFASRLGEPDRLETGPVSQPRVPLWEHHFICHLDGSKLKETVRASLLRIYLS